MFTKEEQVSLLSEALRLIQHYGQTPSAFFTALGALSSIVWLKTHSPWSKSLATVSFGFVGFGGVALALGAEVQDKNKEWGWLGLFHALTPPSKKFLVSLAFHLPQAGIATYLLQDKREDK